MGVGFSQPAWAAQSYTPWKVTYKKWGFAFDAGRQALTGSRKVLIEPHLGIIVPWACARGLGWVISFVPWALTL